MALYQMLYIIIIIIIIFIIIIASDVILNKKILHEYIWLYIFLLP